MSSYEGIEMQLTYEPNQTSAHTSRTLQELR